MTAAPSIDHLSRAELAQLVMMLETKIAPADIAFARWRAARLEWERLSEKAAALWPARLVATQAWEKRPSSLRARRRYEEARTALEHAELASSRAWTAYQRRYAEYEKLNDSRAA